MCWGPQASGKEHYKVYEFSLATQKNKSANNKE